MSSSRFEALSVAFLATLMASCSLGTVSRTSCKLDEECQATFGFGSVCVEGGLCRRAEPEPRCTRTFPADLLTAPEKYPDTIAIGSLMDRSLETQKARENAAELVIRSANDTGGLDGRELGVVFCTIEESNELGTQTRQEAAVASALYLADGLHLPVIIGPSSSADVQAVFEAVSALPHDTLVISPSATGASLTDIDQTMPTDITPGLLWRTAPPDQLQARVIADDMRDRSVTRVAVIHATDGYGEGMAETFLEWFEGDAQLLPFSNSSVLAEQVVSAGSADVEEVLFISSQTEQAAAFINATVGISGFDGKNIFLTDSAANTDFVAATTGSMERWPQIRGTRPQLPSGPVYEIFQSRYITTYGVDPFSYSFAAHAYDAAWIALYGIAWAHHQEIAVNGITIARGLRRISSGTAYDIQASTFQSIVTAFENGEGVDVRGASGEIDYDPDTEETTGGVELWEVDDLE